MKRRSWLKKIFLLFCILFFIFICALWLSGPYIQRIASLRIEERIQQEAKNHGVIVGFKDFQVTTRGISASSIVVRPQSFPFALEGQGLRLHVVRGGIFEESAAIIIGKLRAYKGQIQADLRRNSHFRIEAEDLEVQELLALRSWGVSSGNLHFTLTGNVADTGANSADRNRTVPIESAELDLVASEVSHEKEILLGRRLTGLASDIQIPALGLVTIVLQATLQGRELDISQIHILSDELVFRGSASHSLGGRAFSVAGSVEFGSKVLALYGSELSLMNAGRSLQQGAEYQFAAEFGSRGDLLRLALRPV